MLYAMPEASDRTSCTKTRSSGLCLKCNRILISLCISKAIWLCKNTRFVCPSEPGFTKREKKRSLLKSLKIFYVKKMSQ
ncbi:hypothetical protein P8452_66569 [Trifolium repens]|nr:hypothetical protein P8452_66569 [Trifolium repens]